MVALLCNMKIGSFREYELQESLLLYHPTIYARPRSVKQLAAEYDALALTRLSQNFISRDFLFSIEIASMGLSDFPDHLELVIAVGKDLCENTLEPIFSLSCLAVNLQWRRVKP